MSLPKNTIEGRAEPFLQRIESLLDDLESKRGSYMAECKSVREDIKIVYGEAKDAGVPVKALKGLVKYRQLEKKQSAIADDFIEVDEQKIYEQLVDTLGELGAAAACRAGHTPKGDGDDDDRDLRPPYLRHPDAASEASAR